MSFIFAIIGLGAAVISSYMYGYVKGFNVGVKYPTLEPTVETGLGNVLKWVNEDDLPPTDMEQDYIFWHKCEKPACNTKVEFDDEPWCFTHSPDSGSSVQGYSARQKALDDGHIEF